MQSVCFSYFHKLFDMFLIHLRTGSTTINTIISSIMVQVENVTLNFSTYETVIFISDIAFQPQLIFSLTNDKSWLTKFKHIHTIACPFELFQFFVRIFNYISMNLNSMICTIRSYEKKKYGRENSLELDLISK